MTRPHNHAIHHLDMFLIGDYFDVKELTKQALRCVGLALETYPEQQIASFCHIVKTLLGTPHQRITDATIDACYQRIKALIKTESFRALLHDEPALGIAIMEKQWNPQNAQHNTTGAYDDVRPPTMNQA